MHTITCERCGKSVTRPKGDEGRGRFCSIRCGRLAQPWPTREERFWRKVAKGDGCWEWQGTRSSNMSHGVLVSGPRGAVRREYAHRISWEIHNGPIPDGLDVLHHCDNPPCVRPDHLFVGTQAANNADRDRKGRHKALQGEANGRAALTEAQVVEMRRRHALGEGALAISRSMGVSYAATYQAVVRRSWRHIP